LEKSLREEAVHVPELEEAAPADRRHLALPVEAQRAHRRAFAVDEVQHVTAVVEHEPARLGERRFVRSAVDQRLASAAGQQTEAAALEIEGRELGGSGGGDAELCGIESHIPW